MCVATRSSLLHTMTCLIMQTPQSRSKSTRLCLTSSNHSLEPEYHQRITANTSTSWLFTHGKETSMFSTQKFHTYDVNLYRIIIRSALIGWHGNLSLSAKFLNDTQKTKTKIKMFKALNLLQSIKTSLARNISFCFYKMFLYCWWQICCRINYFF